MVARTRLNIAFTYSTLPVLYLSALQSTSHPPISVADLCWNVNHEKLLISPCPQNLCFKFRFVGCLGAPMAYRVYEINYVHQNTSSKAISPQLFKNFTTFFGTRHLSPSWATSIPSTPHPKPSYWTSIFILSPQPRLGLPSGFFPSRFLAETPYAPLLAPIRATRHGHLILLNLITRMVSKR
jgi:hypothetical protein